MAASIQKVILSFALGCICSLNIAHAKEPNTCSSGELWVGQKQVGLATYAAENCNSSWQGQNIQMDFSYTQTIPEWAFKRAATYFLKKNIGDLSQDKAFQQMTNLYRPVKVGDRYRLDYQHQNQTLTLSLNGRVLGRAQHPQIQQYFSIWLGKAPFSAKLKQQLLN